MLRFGLYLIREGLVNANQLVAALEAQQDALPPLGQIALEEGKLSVREVFSIIRLQSDLPDDRFGDIAIDLGLLNRREVAELLLQQSERLTPLHELIVRQGALTAEQAQQALVKFRRSIEQGSDSARILQLRRARVDLSLRSESTAEPACLTL